jgi:hypothetical protein
MKNTITRVDALNYAIAAVTNSTEILTNPDEIVEVLEKIRNQIAKPRKTSEEAKAKAKVKRADVRAALMEQVLPILRDGLSNYPDVGQTAKELYEGNCDVLPADFTVAKVQYILLHEMADEVIKIEQKNKPNVYKLKS